MLVGTDDACLSDRTALGFTVGTLLDDDLPPPPPVVVFDVETMSMVDDVASSEQAGDTLRSKAMPLPALRPPIRYQVYKT